MSGTEALAALLGVEEHALKARTATQLAFVMVNDTRVLAEYAQAALHIKDRGVVAVSGVSSVEENAPFTLWMARVFRSVEDGKDMADTDRAEWSEWLPPQSLFLPLADADGNRLGTLLLAREQPWDEGTGALLKRLAETYAFAWRAANRPSLFSEGQTRLKAIPKWKAKVLAVGVICLLFPVRLSVLAPAEIVPSDPAVIRAPVDGVIDAVAVKPSQTVKAGDVLFRLDRTSIKGKVDVASKELSTARAELDRAIQQSFFDPNAKAGIGVLKARVAEKQAEQARLEEFDARGFVASPRSGVVVMDDASEWIGRPVSVGEKVLAVADPAQVEVEAWLAPADMIEMEADAPVVMFLNTAPLSPVSAKLSYVAYEATLQPDGLLAHRVRAAIKGDDHPRIGLKGTARLDGSRVPFIYWMLRRPLGVTRQWLGW
ncbi:MAG: HlyD family efflux transporter periplasmic adaptor subunit [Rhodospirillales bacterium]|nr:HlyD family efflux transporter periplasmic adaptor subunit [Rhodospirillales bacterium]